MEIKLRRIALKENYTIGRLYINGNYFCDTIEDKVRPLNNRCDKVYSETAIPYGTYAVTLDVVSPKYSQKSFYIKNANGGRVPRLIDVPFFDGVLIHCGNTEKDSAGCIIVGENKVVGKVVNSQVTFKRLYKVLMEDKNNLKITIVK